MATGLITPLKSLLLKRIDSHLTSSTIRKRYFYKMKLFNSFTALCFLLFFSACSTSRKSASHSNDNEITSSIKLKNKVAARAIITNEVSADEVVTFAETLKGVPYKYGSADKSKGFDCSGFINYVFNHYKISVPRSSSDFTNAGREVSIRNCRRGDLILFTGSDASSGVVGHMGIITKHENQDIEFIHSASGGGRGVMVSGMSDYFITRFVKVIRVFTIL